MAGCGCSATLRTEKMLLRLRVSFVSLLSTAAITMLTARQRLDGCTNGTLAGVALAGHNLRYFATSTLGNCGESCCRLPACTAWTYVQKLQQELDTSSSGVQSAICYLKSAAVAEACPARENCTSWSASPLPSPPSPCPAAPTGACPTGWTFPRLNTSGCACTRLALESGATGQVLYPAGANLSAITWEDRPYPWGGDCMILPESGGSALHHPWRDSVHCWVAEFANHCPMSYGTWYSSTHIRHVVAPAGPTGLPAGPFAPLDVAIPRAAGNPVLLKQRTVDGFYVMFFTNRRFKPAVRNCTGRDPTLWHKEAVYCTHPDAVDHMGINLAYSVSPAGPWSVRYQLIEASLPDSPARLAVDASTNPAAVLLPNGTVLLAYKTWPTSTECRRLVGAASCKAIGLLSTGSGGWNASYTHRPMGDAWVLVSGDCEDPSMYRDPASGTIHMLLHTEDRGGAGASVRSTDLGKTWSSFDASQHAYEYSVTMAPGQAGGGRSGATTLRLTNREEPKLLLGREGTPIALVNQAAVRTLQGTDAPPPLGAGYTGAQSTHLTFTLMQPLQTNH